MVHDRIVTTAVADALIAASVPPDRCMISPHAPSYIAQIIALNVRSNFPLDMPDEFIPRDPETEVEYTIPPKVDEGSESGETDTKRRKLNSPTMRMIKEVDYCSTLNR